MARRKLSPEQAQALLAKWDADDPLKQYRPTITQQAFHASSARHRLLKSVNRGGKSAAATAEAAAIATVTTAAASQTSSA